MNTDRPNLRIFVKTVLTALACAAALFASENITNYSSPVTANDFLKWGDTLWVATSGGLRAHNLRDAAAGRFIGNSRVFPDLHLTAICRDSRGNMWIGSRKGYLYMRSPRGQFTTFSAYRHSEWGITSLQSYGDLIVVGSNKGVSLFDPVKGVAMRNSVRIADFSNPRVNVIEARGNMLFLGCDDGVAYLDSLNVVPLSQRNFYDPGIWKTRRGGPVHAIAFAGDTMSAHSTPSAEFRGMVYTTADSGWIMRDGRRATRITPWGTIQKLFNEDDRRLWIGTLDGFYYSWSAEAGEGGLFVPPEQHRIDGMTLRLGTRAVTAGDGNVWFLPMVPFPNVQWHHGIYRFDGAQWFLYNDNTHRYQFGYIGDHGMQGAAIGSDGTLWAGTSGGNVKHVDPVHNTVGQLIMGYGAFRNVNYALYGEGDILWGKQDALAMDSTGYLWVAVWQSDHGSLVCYDPRHHPVSSMEHNPARAHYRRFFTESPLKTVNITALNVDADNRVFAYDPNQQQLTIFSHSGNPLTDSIKVERVYSGFAAVSEIQTAEDGTTYIASAGGLRSVASGSLEIKTVDSTLTNILSMAIRGNIMWLGTRTNGILRLDLDSGERRWINESSGLPSNSIISLALDKRNGRLWIVTDEGISHLDTGRESRRAQPKSLRAFPNVFSVSGKMQGARRITFTGLEPRATVTVYTVNGSLVAKAEAQLFNENEWRAEWAPRRNLTPGTYIAVAKPSGKRTKIILKP